jgi:hypothetical protein
VHCSVWLPLIAHAFQQVMVCCACPLHSPSHAFYSTAARLLDSLSHVWLQEMVSDVTTLCIRVMRLQGAQVEQLMTAAYDMCAPPANRCRRRMFLSVPLAKDCCMLHTTTKATFACMCCLQ